MSQKIFLTSLHVKLESTLRYVAPGCGVCQWVFACMYAHGWVCFNAFLKILLNSSEILRHSSQIIVTTFSSVVVRVRVCV